eukprot:35040_1
MFQEGGRVPYSRKGVEFHVPGTIREGAENMFLFLSFVVLGLLAHLLVAVVGVLVLHLAVGLLSRDAFHGGGVLFGSHEEENPCSRDGRDDENEAKNPDDDTCNSPPAQPTGRLGCD